MATILGLFQVSIIVAGSLYVRVWIRIYERATEGDKDVFWGPPPALVSFVRAHGPWLLAIPLLWCAFATLSARREDREPAFTGHIFVTGVVLSVALAVLFIWTAWGATMFILEDKVQ
jgi:hypothetical protein